MEQIIYIDPRIQKRNDLIEILNDWGRHIVEVQGIIYDVDEFIQPDTEGSLCIEILGRNITSVLQNQTVTQGFSIDQKQAMIQKIEALTVRRRKMSPLIAWSEFIPTDAFNS